MRIVAGKFRGRTLAAPKTDAIRPTTDRTRESLFNILDNRIDLEGKRAIDLFAGTGALGLEAMSRGASFALFVEQSAQGRALLRTNIENLGLQGATKIFRRDATRLGPLGAVSPFDIAFADPPYGKSLGEHAAQSLLDDCWLNPEALLILEEAADHAPQSLAGYKRVFDRGFGDTVVGIFRRN